MTKILFIKVIGLGWSFWKPLKERPSFIKKYTIRWIHCLFYKYYFVFRFYEILLFT